MSDGIFIIFAVGMYIVIHGFPKWKEFVQPIRSRREHKRMVAELMNELDDVTRGRMK